MSAEGYLLNLLLVAAVILQLRGRRLTAVGLLWPVAAVAAAGVKCLGDVPTSGNDLAFILSGGLLGGLLGCLCGVFTEVRPGPTGAVIAQATGLAAVFWVLGMGCRIAFELYAQHGGGPAIARFSSRHAISGAGAWTACLVLMALAEVLGRTLLLALRAYRIPSRWPADAAVS